MVESYLVPMAESLLFLLEAFILLWLAKGAYTLLYRRIDLKEELFERNNHALATSTVGYLLGIVIALGGVLSGPSVGLEADLVAVALFGAKAIVLMLVAGWLCAKVLLPFFDNTKEVVEDRNLGTAFVEAGMHIGNGLIVLAINQGTGPWWAALGFWVLAQAVLLVLGRVYEWVTPHSIHRQLERDNAAVGLAFGGLLVGMANIISVAVSGDFLAWRTGLANFAMDAAFGILALMVIKKITDVVLAPGCRLGEEEIETEPNIGAGLIEAFGYVGGSMLIVWVL